MNQLKSIITIPPYSYICLSYYFPDDRKGDDVMIDDIMIIIVIEEEIAVLVPDPVEPLLVVPNLVHLGGLHNIHSEWSFPTME